MSSGLSFRLFLGSLKKFCSTGYLPSLTKFFLHNPFCLQLRVRSTKQKNSSKILRLINSSLKSCNFTFLYTSCEISVLCFPSSVFRTKSPLTFASCYALATRCWVGVGKIHTFITKMLFCKKIAKKISFFVKIQA